MNRTALMAATLLATLSTAAFAQNTPDPTSAPPPTLITAPSAAAPAAATPASDTDMQADLTKNLQKAGFTDIKVVPESFLVQGKDRSGNPMTMFLSPDSMTVVTAESTPGAKPPAGAAGMFARVSNSDDLTSKLVGLDIADSAGQTIGTIKDVAFGERGVRAYIVGVGGFLGMGDRYVAVRPSAVKLSQDATTKKWHAVMDTNAAQLKAAPEYKYSDKT